MDEIIDPPVSPYSSVAAIEKWIDELKQRPDSAAVSAALEEAQDFLAHATARESSQ